MTKSILIKDFQQIARLKIEEHYQDKFTYALPEWAYLTTDPEIIATVFIHGKEGVTITKQPVDFEVDFKDINSVSKYADYLNQKMNHTLPVIGYVVFFKYLLKIAKDKNYTPELSIEQINELNRYNTNSSEDTISLFIVDHNLNRVDDVFRLTE